MTRTYISVTVELDPAMWGAADLATMTDREIIECAKRSENLKRGDWAVLRDTTPPQMYPSTCPPSKEAWLPEPVREIINGE